MNRVLISLVIPIVALLGWLAMIEYNISQGQLVRIRAQGYDPRDLLAGHYINFTLNLGDQNPCRRLVDHTEQQQNYCVCLAPDGEGIYHSGNWAGLCSEKPSECRPYISGSCYWGRFMAGVERYSFPERYAPVLKTVPEHSSVVLSVNSSGQAKVMQFLVEEETLEYYAEAKLIELANPAEPIH